MGAEAPHTMYEVYTWLQGELPEGHLAIRTLDGCIVPSKHHSQLRLVCVQEQGNTAMLLVKESRKFASTVKLISNPSNGSVEVQEHKRPGRKNSYQVGSLVKCNIHAS
jgi:hypothetical protein